MKVKLFIEIVVLGEIICKEKLMFLVIKNYKLDKIVKIWEEF